MEAMATSYGEVISTEQITPILVRVVLGGDGLAAFKMPHDTDAYVNVAIPPPGASYGGVFDPREVIDTYGPDQAPARRRYTVRRWDADARLLTLDFVVHGTSGAGGPWAAGAAPGDVLVFNGPGGDYRPDPAADWHLLVGDESALPAIAATLEALAAEASVVVRLVCDGPEHEVSLDSPANLDLVWVHRAEPDALASAVADLDFPAGIPQVFLHGEADEVRAIRRQLVLERGLAAASMSCSPYWRRGMSDEQWRSVKKEFTAAMKGDLLS